MRILMIAPGYPFPTDNGAKRRILATVSYFSKKHEVVLVSLQQAGSPVKNPPEQYDGLWKDYVIEHSVGGKMQTALKAVFSKNSYAEVKYWNREMYELIVKDLSSQQFDCIWVHFLIMIGYLKPFIFNKISGKRPIMILDQHNVEEITYKGYLTGETKFTQKIYYGLELLKAQNLQKKWFPKFDAILCVSQDDLKKTMEYGDNCTNIWLAPNGVDITYFQPSAPKDMREGDHIIVFGGSFDVRMNQDAVCWFTAKIWPLVRQQIPGVQFWIVGRNPNPEIWKLAGEPGIKVTGTVEDVREYYGRAKVFVVPLRFGGGTKLKTLEAMAMGLPVVSTAVGAQGLEVISGQHLYIAERPEDFASRVVELMKDHEKAASIGVAARILVEEKYSWESIMGDVDNKLNKLLSEKQRL